MENSSKEAIDEMRLRDMTTCLRLAKANLELPRSSDFISIRNSEISLMIFEELLWEGLYPIVSIILQTQNTEKVIVVSTNCLIQMILISVESDRLQLQLDATTHALLNFTGLFKEYTLHKQLDHERERGLDHYACSTDGERILRPAFETVQNTLGGFQPRVRAADSRRTQKHFRNDSSRSVGPGEQVRVRPETLHHAPVLRSRLGVPAGLHTAIGRPDSRLLCCYERSRLVELTQSAKSSKVQASLSCSLL
jgi:hypothetical protein